MLCPIGQSNEKPPLQALAKWWEHVTTLGKIGGKTLATIQLNLKCTKNLGVDDKIAGSEHDPCYPEYRW